MDGLMFNIIRLVIVLGAMVGIIVGQRKKDRRIFLISLFVAALSSMMGN